MHSVRREARSHGVLVIEDACQAHGAERDGYRAGAAGDLAAFSFYPGKNLGAAGDAGAVVTSDPELADRVRSLREHGQTAKYVHARLGWTARLDTIQALVLEHKLPLLDQWNDQRREAARFYGEALAGVGDLVLPPIAAGSTPAWHLYVVRTGTRDRLAAFLKDRGIATGLHYPQPVHLTDACAFLGHRAGSFPVAERLSQECLSLPMFPGITEEQLGWVVESVRAHFDG
jgi:dTDP-4-amino-4,6-dideoxygalactose transaminase